MGLFSLIGKTAKLGMDVVDVVVAPVEIAVDLTNEGIVKPLKEVTDDIVEEFESDE